MPSQLVQQRGFFVFANMEWLNLKTSVLHSEEYIGSDPRARATWLNVLLWCVQQENGGRIENAESWKDRQWQQTCGVTAREVLSASPLLAFTDGGLSVWNYPTDKEQIVRHKRESGRSGGLARAQAYAKAKAQASASTEGEREGKGKRNGIQSAPVGTQGDLLPAELPKEPKQPRQPNPLFDALAQAEGSNANLTKSAARAIGVALAEIKAAQPDVTPEEIARRAANYRAQMTGATLTASALAKHWARCATAATTHTHAKPIVGHRGFENDKFGRTDIF